MGNNNSQVNKVNVIDLYNKCNGNILDIVLCLFDDKHQNYDPFSVSHSLYFLLLEIHDFQKFKELFKQVTELIYSDIKKNGLKYLLTL